MLAPGRIYPGAVVGITIAFTDDEGAATDPATVTFKTFSPCGVTTSYVYGTDAEVTQVETGSYRADFSPDRAGRWCYRWESTGTGTTVAEEGNFTVTYSPFYDDCCSDYRA